jgi:hypothetical protein
MTRISRFGDVYTRACRRAPQIPQDRRNTQMKKLVLAAVALGWSAPLGLADDRPLIWQPIKNSDLAYSARVGVRMPVTLQPAAGVEVGLIAAEGGALVEAPVAAWGDMKLRDSTGAASVVSQVAGGRFNARSGSASLTMNYYEKHIATPLVDLERRSDYAVRYDGTAGAWAGLSTKQSVRLSQVRTGSSFVADASTADNFKRISWGLGLEQELVQGLVVNAVVREEIGGSKPAATFRAEYELRW